MPVVLYVLLAFALGCILADDPSIRVKRDHDNEPSPPPSAANVPQEDMGMLEIDDGAENVMLWGVGKPYIMRSDGVLCDSKQIGFESDVFPQSFIHGAAVFVHGVGVIACSQTKTIISCYMIDSDKPEFGAIFMHDSSVNLQGKQRQQEQQEGVVERVKMVVGDKRDIYLYSNSANDILRGNLNTSKCSTHEKCISHSIKWELLETDIQTTKFGYTTLDRDPCMVFFDGTVYLLGGLDKDGVPLRSTFRLDKNTGKILPVESLIMPGHPRVYHACWTDQEHMYMVGGIQQPPDLAPDKYPDMRFYARDMHAVSKTSNKRNWIFKGFMGTGRADFGFMHLRTGRKLKRRLVAVGGVVMNPESKKSGYTVTNAVEFYDVISGYWMPGGDNSNSTPNLPPIAQFAYAVIPVNFTTDGNCDCIPDQVTHHCYQRVSMKPKENVKTAGQEGLRQLLPLLLQAALILIACL